MQVRVSSVAKAADALMIISIVLLLALALIGSLMTP
jgi:hypothetical protein